MQKLLATGVQDQVMGRLASEPWGVPGLVLAHWWAKLGSIVVSCGTRGPGSSVGLLVGKAGSRHGWLKGPVCPKAGVSLLISGDGF